MVDWLNIFQKKRSLTATTALCACIAFVVLCISVSTDFWLYTFERDANPNGTMIVAMHSGLWRKCWTLRFMPGLDKNARWTIEMIRRPTESNNCSTINYLQGKPEGIGDVKPTESITYDMQPSAYFPIAGLLFLMIGCILLFINYCDRKVKVLIFIGGGLFVISGISLLIGIVLYVGSISQAFDSNSGSLKTKSNFIYNYGGSFFLTVMAFVLTEFAGIFAVYLYIAQHRHHLRIKKEHLLNTNGSISGLDIPTNAVSPSLSTTFVDTLPSQSVTINSNLPISGRRNEMMVMHNSKRYPIALAQQRTASAVILRSPSLSHQYNYNSSRPNSGGNHLQRQIQYSHELEVNDSDPLPSNFYQQFYNGMGHHLECPQGVYHSNNDFHHDNNNASLTVDTNYTGGNYYLLQNNQNNYSSQTNSPAALSNIEIQNAKYNASNSCVHIPPGSRLLQSRNVVPSNRHKLPRSNSAIGAGLAPISSSIDSASNEPYEYDYEFSKSTATEPPISQEVEVGADGFTSHLYRRMPHETRQQQARREYYRSSQRRFQSASTEQYHSGSLQHELTHQSSSLSEDLTSRVSECNCTPSYTTSVGGSASLPRIGLNENEETDDLLLSPLRHSIETQSTAGRSQKITAV